MLILENNFKYYGKNYCQRIIVGDKSPTFWIASTGKPYISIWDSRNAKWNFTTSTKDPVLMSKFFYGIWKELSKAKNETRYLTIPNRIDRIFCDVDKKDSSSEYICIDKIDNDE